MIHFINYRGLILIFMSWQQFLLSICSNQRYDLTLLEQEVIHCLAENPNQTKHDLFKRYNQRYSQIEEEAFTQRLKNIYRKFAINNKGHKLPQLHKYLTQEYLKYQNQEIFFSNIGLAYVHPLFPRENFSLAIDQLIKSSDRNTKQVDILQTFAPNLEDLRGQIIECLTNQIKVRILLAWPYSQAAKLRKKVLAEYAKINFDNETNILNSVVSNLETLEKIIATTKSSQLLEIKLYDTLPSLAIYRAGNYMLAAPFLHGLLAVDTFQLELDLKASDRRITQTLLADFELMWQVARHFTPDPNRNWRNDLKILFLD